MNSAPEAPPYQYIIVRDDIAFDRLSAQIAHAARRSATFPEHPHTHAIVLAVSSEAELRETYERLIEAGFAATLIEEPDEPFNGAATAIGCAPIPRKKIRRLLAGLDLFLRLKDGNK